MTKEEWMKVREEPFIPLGVWFTYYKDNGGDIDDPIEFQERWEEVCSSHCVLCIEGRLVQINFQTSRKRLFAYYDSIFNI